MTFPRLAVKGHAVYTIDLATILQLLREFRRSGMLRTEIPAGLPRAKKPCFVVIELQRGEMVSCQVKDAKGQTLLSGREAEQAVGAVGKLNWIFDAYADQETPGSQPVVPARSAPRNTDPLRNTGPLPSFQTPPGLPVPQGFTNPAQYAYVPRRLLELNSVDMQAWPRRHRQVYVLVDGTRSIGQIAAMLSQPPQIIETVLREIQLTGAITLI
jgi:hypothetical protein